MYVCILEDGSEAEAAPPLGEEGTVGNALQGSGNRHATPLGCFGRLCSDGRVCPVR